MDIHTLTAVKLNDSSGRAKMGASRDLAQVEAHADKLARAGYLVVIETEQVQPCRNTR